MSGWVKDINNLKLKDTCITDDMVSDVNKEGKLAHIFCENRLLKQVIIFKIDYLYYYVDPKVQSPKLMKYYNPPDEIILIHHSAKNIERLIYPPEGPYLEQEEEKYDGFLDFLADKGEELPEALNKRRTLRFLVANHWNYKKTHKNILKTVEWREKVHPVILNDNMKELLDNGYMYIHGRDRHFRPLCFSNTKMITELGVGIDDCVSMCWFMCFYLIEQLCVPGKVENWLFISDLGGLSLAKLPSKHIKKFTLEAQDHLKCRIRKFFYFNTTFGLRAIYALISPFLDKAIKEKTCMIKEPYCDELLEFAHPSQVEKRFGGDAEDVEVYWPPFCPSDEYDHDPDDIEDHEPSVEKVETKTSKSYTFSF